MAGPGSVGYTPGTGRSLEIYTDASSVDHPVGLMEFLVGTTPTFVSSSNPFPVAIQGNAAGSPVYVSPGTGAKYDVVPASPAAGAYLPVRLTDGTSFYAAGGGAVTQSGTWTVGLSAGTNSIGTVVLGAGAASIGTVTANAGTGTFAVSAAALPLPSGAATSANQTAANTSLATLATNSPALGQALAAASLPVVLTAAQLSALTPLTTVTVTGTFWQATQPISGTVTANAGTGSFTVAQATGTNLHVVVDAAPTTAVTGTFWQATQPVSAASLPLPTGAATASAQATGNTSLATLATNTPALGQALAAASVPVVLTAAQLSTLTPLTTVGVTGTFWQATQPVSVATLPALAAGTNTIGAVLPTRGTFTDRSGTITAGGTSQTLAGANSSRTYLEIQNLSTGDLYVNFTSAASAGGSSFKVPAGGSWFTPPNGVTTEAVTIYGATTGQAWVSKEL